MSNKDYMKLEKLFSQVVVTKGNKGSELRFEERAKQNEGLGWGKESYTTHTEQFPTDDVSVVDVTGCGDTHTAAMAVSLALSPDLRMATRYANVCATLAVQELGTIAVSKWKAKKAATKWSIF